MLKINKTKLKRGSLSKLYAKKGSQLLYICLNFIFLLISWSSLAVQT